ncbi:MAG: hypothetical protein IT307_19450 [Chloroflexi bacterium]|nr:hypothetical protein [Chloroflexota bacterium]
MSLRERVERALVAGREQNKATIRPGGQFDYTDDYTIEEDLHAVIIRPGVDVITDDDGPKELIRSDHPGFSAFVDALEGVGLNVVLDQDERGVFLRATE